MLSEIHPPSLHFFPSELSKINSKNRSFYEVKQRDTLNDFHGKVQRGKSKQLLLFSSNNTNPFTNLALEEYLLWNVRKDESILYLWQNRQTVVIGVNQNPWKECHIKELEQDGGYLARRLSGGGAVFHDLGNLNFTFLMLEEEYNVDRQLDVIICAMNKFGINAEKSGRNDLLVDGKKFSGNAFYHARGHCFHHGTVLVDTNLTDLSRYLHVSPAKIQSKGVDSVRSRVINLKAVAPVISIESLKTAMMEAFGEVYESNPQPFPVDRITHSDLVRLEDKYASIQWRFGRKLPFNAVFHDRFSWGDLTLQFYIESGVIQEAVAYSDSLETDFFQVMGEALKNIPFSSAEINRHLMKVAEKAPVDDVILSDILRFANSYNF